MLKKCHHHIKRHYRKLAAALASAAVLSAAVVPGLPALHSPAAKPEPDTKSAPVATLNTETPKELITPEANAKQVLDITATAYAPGAHDNDQWGNKTYLGTQVRPGIIAVDPRIIPLGSHVLIKYPDGHSERAVAEDTGGAIKGHRIDVAKWTVNEAENFGIKAVKVYVLKDPPPEKTQGMA